MNCCPAASWDARLCAFRQLLIPPYRTVLLPQVVKALWAYIKQHDLQDPANKRVIIFGECGGACGGGAHAPAVRPSVG